MIKCCMGCEDRYPACHDSCETYLQQVASDEDIKKKKRLESEFNVCAKALSYERKRKWQKQKKK